MIEATHLPPPSFLFVVHPRYRPSSYRILSPSGLLSSSQFSFLTEQLCATLALHPSIRPVLSVTQSSCQLHPSASFYPGLLYALQGPFQCAQHILEMSASSTSRFETH